MVQWATAREASRQAYSDTREGKSRRLDVETAPEWNRDGEVSGCHEGQLAVWEDQSQIITALCGARGGKTALGPKWAVREMVRSSKFWAEDPSRRKALIIGPTTKILVNEAFKGLRDYFCNVLKVARAVESPTPKITILAEHMHKLGCPAHDFELIFCYASDSGNLEAMTASFAIWDEAGQPENKEDSWEAATSRLLTARKAGFGRMLITTTPYEFGWLKRRVIDPCGPLCPIGGEVNRAKKGRMVVYNWPSWLNPDVDKADIDAELESMDTWRWEMRYLGIFTQPEDVIYGCWSELNECEKFKIPEWWERAVGIDFGLKNTAAVIFAREEYDYRQPSQPTGRWILFKTYLDGDKKADEHITAILGLAGGSKRPRVYGGNHAESQSREAFEFAGLGVNEPPVTDVKEQLNCVFGAMKRGDLVAFKTLSKWLDERASYSWARDKDGFLTDKPLHDERYHRLAATRYIAPAIFRLTTGQPKKSRFQKVNQT